MNQLPVSAPARAPTPKPGLPASPTFTRPYPYSNLQSRQSTCALRRLGRLPGLAHVFTAALIISVFAPSARAQGSVTLAWDPSPGGAIAGYRLYEGAASRSYTNVVDVGNNTTGTFSNLVSGTTYFFAVTAYNTNGEESGYSSEVSYTVPLATNPPPTIALSSPADGAV